MAKILLHTLVFSPDSVSTAYLMTDLASQLKTLGHSVTVLTTTPHYNLDQAALHRQPLRRRFFGLLYRSSVNMVDVWHVKLPMKGQRVYTRVLDYIYFHLMSLFIGFLMLGRHDIVIAPSPPLTMGLVSWLLGLRMGSPSIYNVQELYPDFAINQGLIRNAAFISLLRRMERFVYARNTIIVTRSEWVSQIIRQRGVSNGKLTVIPNFVDTELYHPLPRINEFSTQHGLNSDFIILYGGNVGLSQDWDSLLYAAEELSQLPLKFVIVGGGARSTWLEEEVAKRRLKNVMLLGYKPRHEMAMINASADVCTIPMKTDTTVDTFPSKIYTIMACAKPVIVQADANSELAWLVNEVGFGRVTAPDDSKAYTEAVRQAFGQRDVLYEEGLRGRVFVENTYSKEVVGKKYHELIRRLSAG